MKNDEFDTKMRAFEKSNDPYVHPNMKVVVRIDGKNFSTLTRKILKLKPFDIAMRNAMRGTLQHVMQQDFKCLWGYTHSDEMSILLDPFTKTFGGKIRKILSIMASQASVNFSNLINYPCIFDARVIQLPTLEDVCDYFVWRMGDSETNCLNAWAYHLLITREKLSPYQAQKRLDGQDFNFKQDLLFYHDMNYNELPIWQKRGIGLQWIELDTLGFNPKDEEFLPIVKKKLMTTEIPKDPDEYRMLIHKILEDRIEDYRVRRVGK